MEGFCCTFNYVRPTDNFNPTMMKTVAAEDPETSPTSGARMGLTVTVRSNLSDYYYPTTPVIGLKVLIFNPFDYPDTGSGGLTELLVTLQQEVFFSMSALKTVATELVHDLDLERRGCFFNSHIEEKFGELYSYSDCMMDCRIDDIRTKCGCLPFYSPFRVKTSVCGVQNVPCLLRNRGNIGGVCGAIVGFSLMGIIEFLYFFTVRLTFAALDKHRKQRVVQLAEGRSKVTPALEKGPTSVLPRVRRPKFGWAEIYHKSTDLPEVRGYNRRV